MHNKHNIDEEAMISTCSGGVAAGKLYCRKLTKFTLQADKSRLDGLLMTFLWRCSTCYVEQASQRKLVSCCSFFWNVEKFNAHNA